jgi:hypothetical protein
MLHSYWRLWVVLGVQLLIVAATLETRPFDPYDVLSGYYVTLGYEAETPPADRLDPDLAVDGPAWILLARETPAWRVVSVSPIRPTPAADEAVLKATWDGHRARLDDLRKFFISEAARQEVADTMSKNRGRAFVDMRVGMGGEAVLLRLHVGDKTFGAASR